MSGSSYRNFLKLVKDWPVDSTKSGGRDFGEFLRYLLHKEFKQREATRVDEAHWNAVYESLNRIAQNTYLNKYPRRLESTSLNLSKQECNSLLSNEYLHYLKRNRTLFHRVKNFCSDVLSSKKN